MCNHVVGVDLRFSPKEYRNLHSACRQSWQGLFVYTSMPNRRLLGLQEYVRFIEMNVQITPYIFPRSCTAYNNRSHHPLFLTKHSIMAPLIWRLIGLVNLSCSWSMKSALFIYSYASFKKNIDHSLMLENTCFII
jgi:hypothetical protein